MKEKALTLLTLHLSFLNSTFIEEDAANYLDDEEKESRNDEIKTLEWVIKSIREKTK